MTSGNHLVDGADRAWDRYMGALCPSCDHPLHNGECNYCREQQFKEDCLTQEGEDE